MLGVIGVVIFGNNRTDSDFDKESNLSLSLLKEIWGRKEWIIYLVFLLAFIAGSFWFSTIVNEVCMGRIEDDRSTSSGGGGGGSRDREDSGVEGMLDGGGGRRTTGDGTGIVGKFKVLVKDFKIKHGIFRRFVKRKVEGFAQSRADVTLRKSAGLFWAITGKDSFCFLSYLILTFRINRWYFSWFIADFSQKCCQSESCHKSARRY